MSELVPREDDVLEQAAEVIEAIPRVTIPVTGELVETKEPVSVAGGIEAIHELMAELNNTLDLFTLLMRAESARQGTKTLALGDLTVTLSGGQRVEYDKAQLYAALDDAGLPAERLEQVIRPIMDWKVSASGIKQLEAANPLYAVLIDRYRTRYPAKWRATVKR